MRELVNRAVTLSGDREVCFTRPIGRASRPHATRCDAFDLLLFVYDAIRADSDLLIKCIKHDIVASMKILFTYNFNHLKENFLTTLFIDNVFVKIKVFNAVHKYKFNVPRKHLSIWIWYSIYIQYYLKINENWNIRYIFFFWKYVFV